MQTCKKRKDPRIISKKRVDTCPGFFFVRVRYFGVLLRFHQIHS